MSDPYYNSSYAPPQPGFDWQSSMPHFSNMSRLPIGGFSTMANYAQLGRQLQYPFNIQQSPIQNSWLYNTPQNPQVASSQNPQINPSVSGGGLGNSLMNDYGLHLDIPGMADWRDELAKSQADFNRTSSELADIHGQPSGIGNWSNFLFGDQYHKGALGVGADIGKTIMGGILGWKNMQLANDQFNFSKDAYYKNMQNQTKLTNRDILENQKLQHRLDPRHFDDPNDPEWRKENLL